MRSATWLFLMCSVTVLGSEISGELKNGTGDGPATAQVVQLVELAGGMQVVATAQDVSGSFSLAYEGSTEGKSFLVQAVKDGVIYSQSLKNPEEPVVLEVFDTVEDAALETYIGSLAFYAHNTAIEIGAFYNIDNVSNPPTTMKRDGGTFSFEPVPGFNSMEASTRRGTMPLRQQLRFQDGRAILDYPLKPGRTQLMVRGNYTYDQAGSTYTIPLPAGQGGMHVLSLPLSLDLVSENLKHVSSDQRDGVKLYEFTPEPGLTELVVEVRGKPLPAEQAEQRQNEAHGDSPKVENRPNPLHPYRWWIIASVLGLMLIVSILGLRG